MRKNKSTRFPSIYLRKSAIAFWLISLIIPTTPSISYPSSTGLFFFIENLFILIIFIGIPIIVAPLQFMAVMTNIIFIREIFSSNKGSREVSDFFSRITVAFALSLNITVGLIDASKETGYVFHHIGFYKFPGYYIWILSFATLFIARCIAPSSDSTDLQHIKSRK